MDSDNILKYTASADDRSMDDQTAGKAESPANVPDIASSSHDPPYGSDDGEEADNMPLDIVPEQPDRHECSEDSDGTQRQQRYQQEAAGQSENYTLASPELQPRSRNWSPQRQYTGDSETDHLFDNADQMLGSAGSDLDQLYRLSAPRSDTEKYGLKLSALHHPDAQGYDDLPLMFSVPGGGMEDEGSKIYSCNICNFRTAFKNSLVNHQAVHSDVRPWICDICDYAAKRKQDLKKHLQTMHGMVVDSLQLRPGVNPSTLAVTVSCPQPSSTVSGLETKPSLGSPVETKPIIVRNEVVPSDRGSRENPAAKLPSGQNGPPATSGFPSHDKLLGFGQLLPPPSTKVSQMPRSLAMPAVSKFIADKFPFNQYFGDQNSRGLPNTTADMWLRRHFEGGTEREYEKNDEDDDTSDDQSLNTSGSNFSGQLPGGSRHSDSLRECQRNGSRGRLPSVNEAFSKDRRRQSSVSFTDTPQPLNICEIDDRSGSKTSRNETRTASTVAFPHAQDSACYRPVERRKHSSSDCVSTTIQPGKLGRFHSPSSDDEHSPLVSSQSGNALEPMSSVVVRSRLVETDKSFHCQHCNILFFENALYLMHMGLHDNTNPWTCSVCGRTFFEKYSFTSHFINQH